ncbi:MAG: ATP-binding protein [Pseudomonadota bacterium]
MSETEFETLWQALPAPALALDAEGRIRDVNGAAELFLDASQRQLAGRSIERMSGADSRLADLVRQVLKRGTKMSEYDVELSWPELPLRLVDLHAAPTTPDTTGAVVLIHPRATAERMDRALSHRGAARSVAGMSSVLAHEIKNPLAGISGAAQLLDMNADEADRELTQLIRDEADRITALLKRVEQFGDIGPARRTAVNIHDVLDRACRSARAGFAAHARFIEDYDPSLPPTLGDPDQLIQVLMNLLKNAAEAAPKVGGVISIRTAFRAGMKVATTGGSRESLPLQISITDNGPGIPEDMQRHIFEPFVSSKAHGSGLGLSLVSKIVTEHGGIVACDSQPGWTRFRLALPMAPAETIREAAEEAARAAAEDSGSVAEGAA